MERWGEDMMNLVLKKIDGFPNSPPSFYMVMYFLAGFP